MCHAVKIRLGEVEPTPTATPEPAYEGLCAKCKCDPAEQACVDRGRCEPIASTNRHISIDVHGERLVAHLVEVKFRASKLAARINQFVAELAARLLTEQDVIEVECVRVRSPRPSRRLIAHSTMKRMTAWRLGACYWMSARKSRR